MDFKFPVALATLYACTAHSTRNRTEAASRRRQNSSRTKSARRCNPQWIPAAFGGIRRRSDLAASSRPSSISATLGLQTPRQLLGAPRPTRDIEKSDGQKLLATGPSVACRPVRDSAALAVVFRVICQNQKARESADGEAFGRVDWSWRCRCAATSRWRAA